MVLGNTFGKSYSVRLSSADQANYVEMSLLSLLKSVPGKHHRAIIEDNIADLFNERFHSWNSGHHFD